MCLLHYRQNLPNILHIIMCNMLGRYLISQYIPRVCSILHTRGIYCICIYMERDIVYIGVCVWKISERSLF